MSPLDYVGVSVTEALKSASLALTGTSAMPLDPSGTRLNRFETMTVLPFGGSWQITGEGQDFAGLSLDLSGATFTTIEPGVLTEDGFETQPRASLGANASWIDASSGLPIPAGSHALFVAYPVLFHLKQSDASTKASFRVVGLSRYDSSGTDLPEPSVSFQSAVISSANRSIERASAGAAVLPTSNATWTLASEPRTVEFELHDAGSDVAVQISPIMLCPSQVVGNSCLPSAIIIDDLHVE